MNAAVDALAQFLFTRFKHDLAAYCKLETVYDAHSLITETGGLLTMIEVDGIRTMPGEDDTLRIFTTAIQEIGSGFTNGDHTIQVVFESDPDRARNEIERHARPMRRTAERLQMAIDDVLDDYFDTVASFCSRERCWMIVETHPTMLDRATLKKSLNNRIRYMQEQKIPFLTMAQNPFRLVPEIVTPHETFVSAIENELGAAGVSLQAVDVLQALFEIRKSIDPEFTDEDWRASIPAADVLVPGLATKEIKSRLPIRHGTGPANECSHVWNPPLARQLVPRALDCSPDSEFISSDPVRIGTLWYAPVVMEVGPTDPSTFLKLFRRIPGDVPWRISYEIRPGGLAEKWFSKLVTSIFGWMGQTNQKIRAALRGLAAVERDNGVVVGFRFSAVTWATNPRELARRHSALARGLQGWGHCDVTDNIGDPVSGVFATVPAFYAENPAPSMAAPLVDVVHMMPLTRPASPWKTGTVLYRTPDGKPYPMGVASPQQTAWVDLYFAPMGAGKSVLMNTINLMSSLVPGLEEIPWLAVIDVGPSSSGVANLLKESLPPSRKHLVEYFKLHMTPDCAINPFDTQLGCRKPAPLEREFLVNFLALLMTPEGETSPYQMAAKMAGVLVDEIYEKYSDKKEAKYYEEHLNPQVDAALAAINFRRNDHTTWWNVTDALFMAERIHEATLAQRYAVPVLQDLMGVVHAPAILDLFAESADNAVEAGNGQTLVAAFATVISSTIREFPVLSGATRFDIGDARVVVMDLDDVARDRGRRAAVMYMLARFVATRNFYLMPAMADLAPECYRQFHLRRARETKEQRKALVYDEFHRTAGIKALREQVQIDMREGRKWNIRVALASQDINDFDPVMIKLAFSIYILRPSNQMEIRQLCELFGLSEIAAARMERDLTAPGPAGASFLAVFFTVKGRYVQILTNTIGPITRWALTTTAEEMGLRNRLYERLTPTRARRVLARLYPTGAQREIEERRRAMESDDSRLLDTMADEIVDAAHRLGL